MNGRNATRFARLRQARHVDHAPTGQADAARSAALASRARQRGCTSPGLRDSQLVAHGDRESTRRLQSRRQSSGLAMRNRSASGARGRSGTRVRARAGRACGQWKRPWGRTLIAGSISAGKAKEAAVSGLFCTRQAGDFLDTPGGRQDRRRSRRPDVPGWMPPAGDTGFKNRTL